MPRYFPQRQLPVHAYLPGRMSPFVDESTIISSEPVGLSQDTWFKNRDWLFGIDLYNHAYYWETHAVLEAVWLRTPANSAERRFAQAVIQVAAARLKTILEQPRPAGRLMKAAREKCRGLPEVFCGVKASELISQSDTLHLAGGTTEMPFQFLP